MRIGVCRLALCENFNISRHNGRLFSFLNVAEACLAAEGRAWAFGGNGSSRPAQWSGGVGRFAKVRDVPEKFLRNGAFSENSTGEYFIFSQ